MASRLARLAHATASLFRRTPSMVAAHAAFPCSLCTAVACSVELLLPEHPQALSHSPTLHKMGFLGDERIALDNQQFKKVKTALDQKDALALYQVESLFAAFYCRECARSYCMKHWEVSPVFDDQFYDYSDGYCPYRHKKMIDD